jgi:hypothetical protein
MGQMGFFDLSNKLSALSELGDPLEKLNQAVDWSIFQPVLARAFRKERKSHAGRPAYEYLLMFKVLILVAEHVQFVGCANAISNSGPAQFPKVFGREHGTSAGRKDDLAVSRNLDATGSDRKTVQFV